MFKGRAISTEISLTYTTADYFHRVSDIIYYTVQSSHDQGLVQQSWV